MWVGIAVGGKREAWRVGISNLRGVCVKFCSSAKVTSKLILGVQYQDSRYKFQIVNYVTGGRVVIDK